MKRLLLLLLAVPLVFALDYDVSISQDQLPYNYEYDVPVYAPNNSLVIFDSNSDWLKYQNNYTMPNGSNTTNIKVNVSIPSNASFGNYTLIFKYQDDISLALTEILFNVSIEHSDSIEFRQIDNKTYNYMLSSKDIDYFNKNKHFEEDFYFLSTSSLVVVCQDWLDCPDTLQVTANQESTFEVDFEIPTDTEPGTYTRYAFLKQEDGGEFSLKFIFDIERDNTDNFFSDTEYCNVTCWGDYCFTICYNVSGGRNTTVEKTYSDTNPEVLHRVVYPMWINDSLALMRDTNEQTLTRLDTQLNRLTTEKEDWKAKYERAPTSEEINNLKKEIEDLEREIVIMNSSFALEKESLVSKGWRTFWWWEHILLGFGLAFALVYFKFNQAPDLWEEIK